MNEIISGLTVFGAPATDDTVEKLKNIVRGLNSNKSRVYKRYENPTLAQSENLSEKFLDM